MLQISVAAPCNGSGKTSLLLAILRAFPGVFSAAKFTTIYREEQFCPVGNSGCPCHQLQGNYLLCEDSTVLGQPDTDTGKLVQAGALQTFWGVARPEGYAALVEMLHRTRFNERTRLVTEGNTILGHLAPNFLLFVVNPYLPLDFWKRDSEKLLAAADFIVMNPFLQEITQPGISCDPLIDNILASYTQKQVHGEAGTPLDRWKDRRPFDVIRSLLADPTAGVMAGAEESRT